MLFNSFAFLLIFLPVALALHALAAEAAPRWRLAVLALLSFAFYAYWDWRLLPLLLVSIGVNWGVARLLTGRAAGWLLPAAIAANLSVLAAFKYLGFLIGLANLLPGVALAPASLVLPLGISFFTFHHVMYLTDRAAGRAPPYDLTRYALYIAFFPQVLAGPLVRWSEIMHQFEAPPYARADAAERFSRGLMLLVLGLTKKVFLGDPLAAYVNPVFAAASAGEGIGAAAAWQATLGFAFQIYFDFSGYTDMALGLGLMFGVVLPQNFDVPYRATSLRDFWRRWHMTLSRFLRDYLYIPFGGNRRGLVVQLSALFATMALGGLWHGAGLTFVAWGAAHGLGLGVVLLSHRRGLRVPAWLGGVLTFAFVTLAWVLFRATDFSAALRIYQGLAGLGPKGGAGLGGESLKWRGIALAAPFALLGPTAWALAQRIPPRPAVALGFALLFVLVLLKIGDDANYEFIYFQF